MTVLEMYSYRDQDGRMLMAAPGFATDGASIPRALWTIVGSPFTGLYIGAAVIHDVGCDNHKYSWQTTHRMFYTAMKRLGVSENYAKLLYWGVRLGGPKWRDETVQAPSVEALRQKALAETGHPIDDGSITERRHGTANSIKVEPPVFSAIVHIPFPPTPPISDETAHKLYSYITSRSYSKSGAVTLN